MYFQDDWGWKEKRLGSPLGEIRRDHSSCRTKLSLSIQKIQVGHAPIYLLRFSLLFIKHIDSDLENLQIESSASKKLFPWRVYVLILSYFLLA